MLPAAGYSFDDVVATMAFGPQRPISGTLTVARGTFYDGHKTAVGFSSGRVNMTKRIVAEPTLSLNWVDLREGSFTDSVIGSRLSVMLTPRMFVSALMQYGSVSDAAATNVRLRWEYQPGSELLVVYNDQRHTRPAAFLDLSNRAFLVKISRFLRF